MSRSVWDIPVQQAIPACEVCRKEPAETCEHNGTFQEGTDTLQPLIDSIRASGQLEPVRATQRPDGRYLVHYGLRRLQACLAAGVPVKVRVYDKDDPDLHPVRGTVDSNWVVSELPAGGYRAGRPDVYLAMRGCNLCGRPATTLNGLCVQCVPVACPHCHGKDCERCDWQGRRPDTQAPETLTEPPTGKEGT